MKKPVLFGLGILVAGALTGCGGDSLGVSSTLSSYSVSDYTAVEDSSSLVGTWVMVKNGSQKDVESNGYWSEQNFSARSIVIIKEENTDLKIANCSSGFSTLYEGQSGAYYMPEGQGSASLVVGNNSIAGNVNTTGANGEYEKYTFEYIKVSNNIASLGSITTDWSGSSSNVDTAEDITAFCAQSLSELDSDTDRSTYNEYEFGVESIGLYTKASKGTLWGEAFEQVTVSGNPDTISTTTYWEEIASVDITETKSALTGLFSLTKDGKSAVITVDALFPVQ